VGVVREPVAAIEARTTRYRGALARQNKSGVPRSSGRAVARGQTTSVPRRTGDAVNIIFLFSLYTDRIWPGPADLIEQKDLPTWISAGEETLAERRLGRSSTGLESNLARSQPGGA
jgi:hypothetical protein